MGRWQQIYPETEETFLVSGLGAAPHKRGRVRRVCASDKLPWAFMRLSTCVEYYPDVDAPSFRASDSVNTWVREVVSPESAMQEVFLVVCVDTKNTPLGLAEVSRGGRAAASVDRVLVFQPAVMLGASGIIVLHNHPSGVAMPSDEDVAMTKMLVKAGEVLGITVLDHIVLGADGSYMSFLDMGLMRPS